MVLILAEKVIITQKPPEKFDKELKRRRIELILIEAVDMGRLMTEIVAENANKIAEALGIEYDSYDIKPSAHPPWVRDISFFKDGKTVLEVEVKTVTIPDRLKTTIRRLLRDIVIHKIVGVIAIGAGYRKKGETKDDLGLLMIILTPEYVRDKSVIDIVSDIKLEIERKRIREGYERLYLVAFRDKLILRTLYATLQLEKRMATKEDLARLKEYVDARFEAIEKRMATKEDLARLEIDLNQFKNEMNRRLDVITEMLKKLLKEE